MKSTLIVVLCGVLSSVRLPAQTDTTSTASLFTYRDAILAGVFVGVTFAVRPLDQHYAERLQDSSTQDSHKIHKLSTFVRTVATPGSSAIGITMYGVGKLTGNERLASLGLHGMEALLLGEGIGATIKGVVGRQRPYVTPRNPESYGLFRGFLGGDQFRSFPSGHSVAAFAAAAAVTGETSQWWPDSRWIIGPVLYTGAALTGISRMYDNRHWASDVVVGAAIGTFTGLKVVRYNAAHPHNKIDKFFLGASITPVGDNGHTVTLSVSPAPPLGMRVP